MSISRMMAAVVALASVASTPPPAQPEEPDSVSDVEQIALQKEYYDRVTVPVHLMGIGPYKFMVDTGAQATVVSTRVADEVGLHERRAAVLVGMASKANVETAEVPQFTLGSREFHIQTAPIVPQENLGLADGILGLDSLQNQRVLIDFVKKRILVADSDTLGGNVGYEIIVKARRKLGQLIITGARINGIDTDVIVDTGSQSSLGNMALLKRLRSARALPDNTITDVNGEQLTGNVKVVRKLEIDRMSISNLPIIFADAPPFESLGMHERPALILGITELKLFRRVAIDFSNQKILFDLPHDVRGQNAVIGGIIG
ncbi:aspartyl protease family protein [Croceibacterium aestuarii]|uniref:aspartyl protease family protein n=1 Tax=Croceibacterium aestuarii TaxID=3064139 RepID=UPI00272EA449|nr:aspartyl protease family protein [Croceibacterium sp. D39]